MSSSSLAGHTPTRVVPAFPHRDQPQEHLLDRSSPVGVGAVVYALSSRRQSPGNAADPPIGVEGQSIAVTPFEQFREGVLQQGERARLMGDVGDRLRHQTRVGPDALQLGRASDRVLELVGHHRGNGLGPCGEQLAEPWIRERPIVEVGTERHDHTESAPGVGGRDAERLEEQLSLAFVRREREELLELIDHEHDVRAVGCDEIHRPEQPAGSSVDHVVQSRHRTHGDSQQGRRQLLDGVRTREHLGDGWSLRLVESPSTDRGDQARADHRGLAAPARADDGEELAPRPRLVQPGDQAFGEFAPAEEVARLGGGEGSEALVRVAYVLRFVSADRVRFEGGTGFLGERDGRRDVFACLDSIDQLRQGNRHVGPEKVSRQSCERAYIVVHRRHRADPDAEVREIGVPLGVEQHVGRSDASVRDPVPMREGEGGGDLFDEADRSGPRERPGALLDASQATSPQVTRDDVGAAWLSPVVVDRHDVRVFERRDGLRLRLEPSHEGGVARDVLGEHLDGHVAADVGLDRPEDGSRGTVVDPFQESVAAERLAAEVESGVLFEDPLVESRELGRRVDAELVGQDLPRALIGAQRLGLPSVAVEGRHQQSPEAFPERAVGEQRLELPDRPRLGSAGEESLDPVLLRLEPQFVEARGLGHQRPLVREVGERGTAPQRQGILERRNRDGRGNGEGMLRIPHQRVEASCVEVERVEDQDVTGGTPLQQVLAEGPTKVGDVGLQRVPGSLRRLLAPDLGDQRVRRHQLIGADHQVGEHGALLRPAEGDRAVPRVDLERSQDAELHSATVHSTRVHEQCRSCTVVVKNRTRRRVLERTPRVAEPHTAVVTGRTEILWERLAV